MLRDAQLFASRISKLDGSGDLGDSILTTVKDRTLPVTEVPATTTPAATAGTEAAKTTPEEPPLPPTPVVEISGSPPNPPLPASPDEVAEESANGDVAVANGVVELVESPSGESDGAIEAVVEVDTSDDKKDGEQEIKKKEKEDKA